MVRKLDKAYRSNITMKSLTRLPILSLLFNLILISIISTSCSNHNEFKRRSKVSKVKKEGFNIANGVEKEHSFMQGVFRIYNAKLGSCTANAIKHNIALTAAHCVTNVSVEEVQKAEEWDITDKNNILITTGKYISPIKVSIQDKLKEYLWGWNFIELDVAILEFEDNTFEQNDILKFANYDSNLSAGDVADSIN